MPTRFAGAFVGGLVVTSLLLLLMQALVFVGRGRLGTKQPRTVMEFVRVRPDTTLETKQRERPERVKPEEPPPPQQMDFDDIAPPDQVLVGLAAPDVGKELGLAGAPGLGGAGGDTDVIPLVRVNPQYPPRAQAAGVEGRVHLRFTVTAQGTTTDVEVVAADPPGYFEQSAINAVEKYKYKPRVEGGQAVAKPGVEVVLAFTLKRS